MNWLTSGYKPVAISQWAARLKINTCANTPSFMLTSVTNSCVDSFKAAHIYCLTLTYKSPGSKAICRLHNLGL